MVTKGTKESDYDKIGDDSSIFSKEKNVFPAFGYVWTQADNPKDFSVKKEKETPSKLAYNISGANLPTGLTISRIVTVGNDASTSGLTRIYLSKALTSAGADGTKETRNAIDLIDGELESSFSTVSIDSVIYTLAVT